MALRSYSSMAHTDDQLYDLCKGMPDDWEPPEFPSGLQFSVKPKDLAKAGAEGGDPGDMMHFSAIGEVTSVYRGMNNCRIELALNEMAGEDGKFSDLEPPACIYLCEGDLEKLGLEADCDLGDTLHLIGTARLECMSSSEWGEMVTLQIVELTVEDESSESREG
jgi:hypothetical protein